VGFANKPPVNDAEWRLSISLKTTGVVDRKLYALLFQQTVGAQD